MSSSSSTPVPASSPDQLARALAQAIRAAYAAEQAPRPGLEPWPTSRMSRAELVAMAREVLAYQAAHNRSYAGYAAQLGVELAAMDDPLAAPPVPTDAFKRLRLTTFDPEQAVACFRSSGTTQAERSQHLFRTLEVMRAAIEPPFVHFVVPDLVASPPAQPGGGSERIHMVVLAPTPAQVPESSLYFMFGYLCERFAWPGLRTHFFDDALDLDVPALCRALQELAERGQPVLLLGPSFSYVHLFERAPELRVRLPARSRLLETGGLKGRSRQIPRAELHEQFAERLGLEPGMIVGEYGMSELSSQLYEPAVRWTLAGQARPPRVYVPPPWCVVRILDPVSLAPLPPGEEGLVAFFDVANLDSVAAVVTGDLGVLVPGDGPPGWHGLPAGAVGLELHGRAAGASAKGCSLAVDMVLGSRHAHDR